MADYPNAPRSTKVNNVENAVGGNDDDLLYDWKCGSFGRPETGCFQY